MTTSELKNGRDWLVLGKQYLVPIVLLAIIGIESSFIGLTMINQSRTPSGTESSFPQLQEDYEALQEQYTNLTEQYTNLTEEYEELEDDYEDLQDDYEELQYEYYVEQCLHIGNSLASYYNYLRQEIGPTGASDWWNTPDEYWQLQADFAANLALHNLAEIYWPSIEDYYSDVVGEYSYETAYGIIQDVMTLIGVRSSDSNPVRIEKILDFIVKYIVYEYDVNDIFSAPVETLAFRSGDCDDFTILAATLLEAAGIDTAIGFFVNDDEEYHAMVLVHLENLGEYGYWYYSDLTDLGLVSGWWIIIEGQITLEEQDTDWMAEWYLFATAAVDT